VKVDSTKINLRSLALGILSGKAICLSGPVCSGKTSFVEYLEKRFKSFKNIWERYQA
jgi:midasin